MIRIAHISDLGRINKLLYNNNAESGYVYKYPWPIDKENFTENTFYIIEEDENVIAFLALHKEHGGKDTEATFEMVVHKDSREKGHGKTLLKYVIEDMKEKTVFTLLIAHIPNGNNASYCLCKKFGFTVESNNRKGFDMTLKLVR